MNFWASVRCTASDGDQSMLGKTVKPEAGKRKHSIAHTRTLYIPSFFFFISPHFGHTDDDDDDVDDGGAYISIFMALGHPRACVQGLHISLIYILNSMGLALSSFDQNTNTFSPTENSKPETPNSLMLNPNIPTISIWWLE